MNASTRLAAIGGALYAVVRDAIAVSQVRGNGCHVHVDREVHPITRAEVADIHLGGRFRVPGPPKHRNTTTQTCRHQPSFVQHTFDLQKKNISLSLPPHDAAGDDTGLETNQRWLRRNDLPHSHWSQILGNDMVLSRGEMWKKTVLPVQVRMFSYNSIQPSCKYETEMPRFAELMTEYGQKNEAASGVTARKRLEITVYHQRRADISRSNWRVADV